MNEPRGEAHKDHKLTEGDIRLVRQLRDERVELKRRLKQIEQKAIAEKFEVSVATISDIERRVTWRHVWP